MAVVGGWSHRIRKVIIAGAVVVGAVTWVAVSGHSSEGERSARPATPEASGWPIPEAIEIGPLEFKLASLPPFFFVLALVATYFPQITGFFRGARKNRLLASSPVATGGFSEVNSANALTADVNSSDRIETGATATSAPTQSMTVHVDAGTEAESQTYPTAIEYVSRGAHIGAEWAHTRIASQMVRTLISEADALASSFKEEQHKRRFRKSRIDDLAEFCENLQSRADETWLVSAAAVYRGTIEEKREFLIVSHQRLELLRRQLFQLVERDPGPGRTPAEESGLWEPQYEELFHQIFHELDELIRGLQRLDEACQIFGDLTTQLRRVCHAMDDPTVSSPARSG